LSLLSLTTQGPQATLAECPIICEVFTYPNEPFEPKVIAKGIDSNGKIIAGDLSDSYISETF
jgi:hypothetical protein